MIKQLSLRLLSLRLCVLVAAASFALGECATVADDAPAIQAALDSGEPVVTIPAGTYNIGQTLLIGEGTTLKADENAVFRLANGANKFLITNRLGANNITLEGGIWDGNNQNNERGEEGDPNGYPGSAINFFGVNHLTISDLTIRNPDAFAIRLGNVQNFSVRNITLANTVLRLNQDGVHVGGNSRDGVISGITANTAKTPNDDMVALNADDDVKRVINLGLENGPISNVLVENLRAENAYTFVRLLSNGSILENITVRDVAGGFNHYAVNMNNWRFPVGAGNIRNVRIENFDVTHKDNFRYPAIGICLNVQDMLITDFVRNDSGSVNTLVLDNDLDNLIRFEDGSEWEGQDYSIPQGDIGYLWLNPPEPVPEPTTLVLSIIGLAGLLTLLAACAWRKRK